MKYLSLLCLVCLFTPVHAEIYKGVNAEGQTIYSDEKLPNTEKMPTPTDNVIQMPKLIVIQAQKDDDDGDAYVYLNIDKPANDEIIRNNAGNLSVHISIKPALRTEDGHYIALYLDGKEVTPDVNAELDLDEKDIALDTESDNQNTNPDTEQEIIPDTIKVSIPLSNVDRGMHTIYTEVIDENDEALITSNSVTFHMKRQSSQHNKPFGTPPGPVNTNGQPYSPGSQGIIFKPGPIIPPPQ